MTKRLGLSRSNGSMDGSNSYTTFFLATTVVVLLTVSSFSIGVWSGLNTSSIPLSFGSLFGRTFDSFSVNTLRGL